MKNVIIFLLIFNSFGATSQLRKGAQKKADKEYTTNIETADDLFSRELYVQSKIQYEKALAIKPSETYPQSQVAQIEKIVAVNSEYSKLIIEGDEYFLSHSYQSAKDSYKKASRLKPDEIYPKGQINLIDTILKAEAKIEVEKQYVKLVTAADKAYTIGEFEKAKKYYTRAIGIKPTDEYIIYKLHETEKRIKK